MADKIGRNDLCPCGSGKKYKQCCLITPKVMKRKINAVWLNNPQKKEVVEYPNLMERTYGNAISTEDKPFKLESEEDVL